jgi:hypothetical protein
MAPAVLLMERSRLETTYTRQQKAEGEGGGWAAIPASPGAMAARRTIYST